MQAGVEVMPRKSRVPAMVTSPPEAGEGIDHISPSQAQKEPTLQTPQPQTPRLQTLRQHISIV